MRTFGAGLRARSIVVVTAMTLGGVVGLVPGAPAALAAPRCPDVAPTTGAVDPRPTAGVDWSGCDLSGADLSRANLQEADLTGADLTGATVFEARLAGTQLTGATLDHLRSGRVEGTPAGFPGNWYIDGGYLIGDRADLSGADLPAMGMPTVELHDVDFSGANLSHADLRAAALNHPNLTGTDLSHANMGLTVVIAGDLTDADLSSADLYGVIIGSSNMTRADLSGASLAGGVYIGGVIGTPLLPPGFVLRAAFVWGPGVQVAQGDFPGIDLAGVDLTGADLDNGRFSGGTLAGADLTGAKLYGADLSGANLAGTKLSGTDFYAANLWGATSGGITGTPFALPAGWQLIDGTLSSDTGFLRVVSSPAAPSQITVDGHVADTWGLSWLPVPVGSHVVCFSSVPGLNPPGCQVATVTRGATTTVTGAFGGRGYLHVVTSPAVASQITVDSIPRDDWGLYTDLATGYHRVCFGAVANFTAPACQTVAITQGATATVTGTFTPSPGTAGITGFGLLRVTTSPALPSQISIDGSIADSWGLNWLHYPTGSHTVCFSDVPGYTTPPCQTVTLKADATTTVTGTFTKRPYLKVVTDPAVAGTILLDGQPADVWGLFTDLPTGNHTVCARGVPGRITPKNCWTVSLNDPAVFSTLTIAYG